MLKKKLLLILVFVSIVNFVAAEDQIKNTPPERSDLHDFHVLDINIFNAGISSFEHKPSMAMGMTWETNLSKYFLFRTRLLFAFPEILGFKADMGLAYILKGTRKQDDYKQIGWIDRGNIRTSYSISGVCKTNTIHSIDFGIRQYILFVENDGRADGDYNYTNMVWEEIIWKEESRCFDTIAYLGYRYDKIYNKIMPIQQISFSLHGMAGLINQQKYRTENGLSVIDSTQKDLAFGVMGKIKWWCMEFEAGYFDNNFYMEAGLLFSFTSLKE